MKSSIFRISACALLILSVPFMSGCDEQEAASVEFRGEALYFSPIGYGQSGGISDTTELALRSPDQWSTYRDSLNPVSPFDSVDFSQSIVLLAALPQSTSGFGVQFTSVMDMDSVVIAEYVVNVPAEDCLTALAETVPFQAILVRRTNLPVKFIRSEEEYRCTFGPRR